IILIAGGILIAICLVNIAAVAAINTFYPELLSSAPADTIGSILGSGDPAEVAVLETAEAEQAATEAAEEPLPTQEPATTVPQTTPESIEADPIDNAAQEQSQTPEPEQPAEVNEPEPTATLLPPTPTPLPSVALSCEISTLEAENGEFVGDVLLETDDEGEAYITFSSAVGQLASGDQAINNRVDYCFGVPQSGLYRLSGRMQGFNEESNSFYVSIEQKFDQLYPWHTFPRDDRYTTELLTDRDVDVPSNKGEPVAFFLEAGDRTISIHHREAGTRIDHLILELVLAEGSPELDAINPVEPEQFYISLNGNNGDGRSWESAWSDLDEIDWSQVGPGDTLNIDGGETEMTYESSLQVMRSGIEGNPITFRVSDEPGHDGQVVLFGGRAELLPECGAPTFIFTQPEHAYGIRTNDHDWLVFEGKDWYGITIHGYDRAGIRIDRYSNDILVRNMAITNNGFPIIENDAYTSDGPGIRLGGSNLTFERMVVHDNGQDSFQASWDYYSDKNVVIRQSWLYNGRQHSDYRGSWNWCTHTDSFQVYEGFEVRNITFEETFLGPGLTNSIILGDRDGTHVQNLTLRDVVVSKPDDNGLNMYTNPS
ncbi:MAG: hypothetical protein AAF633_28460, partial [Chloroflexota bacterium]